MLKKIVIIYKKLKKMVKIRGKIASSAYYVAFCIVKNSGFHINPILSCLDKFSDKFLENRFTVRGNKAKSCPRVWQISLNIPKTPIARGFRSRELQLGRFHRLWEYFFAKFYLSQSMHEKKFVKFFAYNLSYHPRYVTLW